MHVSYCLDVSVVRLKRCAGHVIDCVHSLFVVPRNKIYGVLALLQGFVDGVLAVLQGLVDGVLALLYDCIKGMRCEFNDLCCHRRHGCVSAGLLLTRLIRMYRDTKPIRVVVKAPMVQKLV